MAKKQTATVIKEIVPVATPVVPPIEEQPPVVPPIEEQPPVVPPIEEQPPVVPPIEEHPLVEEPQLTKADRVKQKAQEYLDKIQKEADERTPPVENPDEDKENYEDE